MWKPEIYRSITQEFATAVGVATTIAITDIRRDPDIADPPGRERYRRLTDEVRVNRIIAESVRIGRYPEVARKRFWLERIHPEWSDRRLWAAAWREVAGRPVPKPEAL